MTTVKFYNMPNITPTYEHVMDFESVDSRKQWFNNQPSLDMEVNIKYDGEQPSITVKKPFDEMLNYDYVYIPSVHKDFFYFVTNVLYETPSTTTMILELDVWQTYYFNVTFMDSFVERCHVQRWASDGYPTLNTEDEGLDFGDNIMESSIPQTLYTGKPSIVMSASTPIGYVPGGSPSGGGEIEGDCWQQGMLSPQGFRFIKGFEGFAPREYQDSGGYWTIAYGVTKHGEPGIYANLVAKQPVSEEEGAKISYDLKNKNYGLRILDSVKAMGISKQCQFDALLSVAYNSGTGSITGSNSLTNAISKNPNDESVIRPVWENFKVTSGGVQLPGLVARRREECNMYFGKPFETRPIELINTSGSVSGTIEGDGWLPSG